jgi:hypothetical protein
VDVGAVSARYALLAPILLSSPRTSFPMLALWRKTSDAHPDDRVENRSDPVEVPRRDRREERGDDAAQ